MSHFASVTEHGAHVQPTGKVATFDDSRLCGLHFSPAELDARRRCTFFELFAVELFFTRFDAALAHRFPMRAFPDVGKRRLVVGQIGEPRISVSRHAVEVRAERGSRMTDGVHFAKRNAPQPRPFSPSGKKGKFCFWRGPSHFFPDGEKGALGLGGF